MNIVRASIGFVNTLNAVAAEAMGHLLFRLRRQMKVVDGLEVEIAPEFGDFLVRVEVTDDFGGVDEVEIPVVRILVNRVEESINVLLVDYP